MPVLNPLVQVSIRAPAGAGASVNLVATNVEGTRGLVSLTTGASGLAGGPQFRVQLPVPVTTDLDVWTATQSLGFASMQNGRVFAGCEVTLTPFLPAPPVGVAFITIGDESQGQLMGFFVGTTGLLAPNTTYRLSWRVSY